MTAVLVWSPPPSARPLTIAEVMKVSPPTIRADAHFAVAHALMRGHGVRHLPVLDDERRLIGVLSHDDLYTAEATDAARAAVDFIAAALSAPPCAVAPGDLVTDVAREMSARGLDCAVVVDRGQVVGLFTASDSLALLTDRAAP